MEVFSCAVGSDVDVELFSQLLSHLAGSTGREGHDGRVEPFPHSVEVDDQLTSGRSRDQTSRVKDPEPAVQGSARDTKPLSKVFAADHKLPVAVRQSAEQLGISADLKQL